MKDFFYFLPPGIPVCEGDDITLGNTQRGNQQLLDFFHVVDRSLEIAYPITAMIAQVLIARDPDEQCFYGSRERKGTDQHAKNNGSDGKDPSSHFGLPLIRLEKYLQTCTAFRLMVDYLQSPIRMKGAQ
jgi:hypothetical protein